MSSNGNGIHAEGFGCAAPEGALATREVTMDWAKYLGKKLVDASWQGIEALKDFLPAETAVKLLEAACVLLRHEATVVDLNPTEEGACVRVVGDTHGQLHDVLHMLDIVGYPSSSMHIIFNGDFVDRGAWGLETLIMLAAMKLAAPQHVSLLRGNHESSTCTQLYGFRTELFRKYGTEAQQVYKMCKQLFAALPLAAVVGGAALVVHGGLFRRPAQRSGQRTAGSHAPPKKRKRYAPMRLANATPILGSLEDLRAALKGGLDPNGLGSSVVAADVLWSDPVAEPGLHSNTARGVGLIFGPDVTQDFLEANKLRLILRSHEGPDARCGRDDLPDMSQGFTIDHVTPAGRLLTVFSAPDYPQFQAEGQERYQNLGAVAVLKGPEWDDPEFVQFEAVHPRPEVAATYEYNDVPGSDEEMELGLGSDASLASSCGGSEFSDAMSEGERKDEVSSLHADGQDHDEGYARQASSAAMAATAKAVAKLKLQQEQGPQLGSNGLPSPADPCNGNGGSSGTPAADSETEAEAPHAVLLNSAESGYIADTEDGLALKKPSPPSNGHRSSSLRPRSRQ